MRPCWEPGSSPLRSTPGRTRTCDCLHVKEPPLPLGHGSRENCRLQIEDFRLNCKSAICNLQSAICNSSSSRLGWIRTSDLHHVRVASVPLLHETKRSGRQESNLPVAAYQTAASPPGPRPEKKTSALYGTRTRLACSTGRSPHPLRHRALSKNGRIRTHSVGFGDRLLSQEHVLVTDSCPGRIRTCSLPVNSGSHHRCATGQ